MSKQDSKLPSLTLFFPAYNEAGNIAECIKQALFVAKRVAHVYEIIIINDGSTDATKQIAERIAQKYSCVKVVSQKNKGYGGAVKRGFKEAQYEWVFFSDSDLQFDLREIKTFIPFTKNHPLILGYRTQRAEGFKRKILAKMLKLWNHILLHFPRGIKDIDCAFKLIHNSVIKKVGPLVSDGAMVSTEFLLKASRNKITYQQVGVKHYIRAHGTPTGNDKRVILKAIQDTFLLRYLLLRTDIRQVMQKTQQLSLYRRSRYTG